MISIDDFRNYEEIISSHEKPVIPKEDKVYFSNLPKEQKITNFKLRIYPYARKLFFKIDPPFKISNFVGPRMMIFGFIGITLFVCMKNMPDLDEMQKAQAAPGRT